ncbi:MAG: oxidoreductase, partial [Bacteroidia bacterium]|nr:oxidoreductase [Bacteroidia bacterium]
ARESVLSPEEAAKRAIHGMLEKEDVVIPGFINKCLLLLDKILPQFLKDSITANEIKKFKD